MGGCCSSEQAEEFERTAAASHRDDRNDRISGKDVVVIDINSASEEELTAVNGIGPSLARKIVEDRRQGGPYLNVDDLQRVVGIGPGLLEKFRNQLTCRSTAAGEATNKPGKAESEFVDINSATSEQLQTLPGVGKSLALKIAEDRETNGPFSSVDDLLRVSGIGRAKLDGLQSRVMVHGGAASKIVRGSSEEGKGGDKPPARKHKTTTTFLMFNGRDVVRVATWNLQQFSVEKADNVGVKEVVCCTILKHILSIVVVQELADEEALQKICDELNSPTLPEVKKYSGQRQDWQCVTSPSAGRMYKGSEYNGFLWDASKGISLKSSSLLDKLTKTGKSPFVRRPFLGFFKAGQFDFVAVSVHLKAAGLQDEDRSKLLAEVGRLPDLIEAIHDHLPGEKDVLMLGDFNLQPGDDGFQALAKYGYHHALPADVHTNISPKNLEGSRSYDNIWMSTHTLNTAYSRRYGAVRDGLTHDKIPNGWSWGGTVSDHVPIWSEFFVDHDSDRGSKVSVSGIAIDGSS